MAGQNGKIRVALNGYGVIGKRVADAVACQDDMELVGIADIATDWRLRVAAQKGFKLFASLESSVDAMRKAGFEVAGTLDALLGDADIVVDCTPKRIGAKNAEHYRKRGVKFIVQGGEKHEVTGTFVRRRSELCRSRWAPIDPRRLVQHDLGGANADRAEACRASAARTRHADAARHGPVGEPQGRHHEHTRSGG